jgi:2-polyprenyl-3-methyl-5-hydroxy-6-metoxy-1,4-benzoquinol methylase
MTIATRTLDDPAGRAGTWYADAFLQRYAESALRPATRKLVARLYDAAAQGPVPEDRVEVAPGVIFPAYLVNYAGLGRREAHSFLERMPSWLEFQGKSVLDVGCGAGSLCMEVARRGADRVFGVDTGRPLIEFALWQQGQEAEPFPVEFRAYGGNLEELGDETFDIILSKDSFERYTPRPGMPGPEAMARRMVERMKVGGLLVMRLGPLWKAPYGGHIESWLPWAHLAFPESIIFEHYRRVRPPGKTACTFEDGVGVNRMTLARLRCIMDSTGLEQLHFATNVGRSRAIKVVRILSRVPGLREAFTQNVYGVWRKPHRGSASTAGRG